MSEAQINRTAAPAPRREEIVIYLGGLHVSSQPIVIKTLLGSCIAVCLYDPIRRMGGMNHFMLPHGGGRGQQDAARFGVHAMDLLITALMKSGADRRRLVAKVFGGAHVLDISDSPTSVPRQNVAFIHRYLEQECLPILAKDVGGSRPREIHFHTKSGQVFVRKVSSAQSWKQLLALEKIDEERTLRFGEVTLFDEEQP